MGHRGQTLSLSRRLTREQLLYLGSLARRPDDDPIRQLIFESSGLKPRNVEGPRRRGCPRLEWATEVLKHAVNAAGDADTLSIFLERNEQSESNWQHAVRGY